ncbi:hypothetical protein DPMN_091735 [Dreissena polymorpha]|uniref:Lipase domain-containing protein n=1 Tax=Dreissena polymorpha TaxID=45954 RepID=A0A9D4L0D3_DREPO|nr:hypothetical protein DPMN_091735 [Dreissena polymorpha]
MHAMRQEDLNVIIVDWEKGAGALEYNQAVANCRVVGAMTARLLQVRYRWVPILEIFS